MAIMIYQHFNSTSSIKNELINLKTKLTSPLTQFSERSLGHLFYSGHKRSRIMVQEADEGVKCCCLPLVFVRTIPFLKPTS